MKEKKNCSLLKLAFLILMLFTIIAIAKNIKAYQLTENDICKDSYYFILEHLNSNYQTVYSQADLIMFANSISYNNTDYLTTHYIEGYKNNCQNQTNLILPSNLNINPSFLNQTSSNSECNYLINKTILGYDMDTSMPFLSYEDSFSCNSVNNLKYLFSLEPTINGYKIMGFKFFWFLVIIIFILLYLLIKFIKSNRLLNKAIRGLK
jgi:hypothetical protein